MTKLAIDELREQVRGDVITPDDGAYDEARRVNNAMIDKRPQVVVRIRDAGDVKSTVDFAREHELDLSVRGGGHSVPGFGTCDDGVVIDLSLTRGVRVDLATTTARAEGGATWGTSIMPRTPSGSPLRGASSRPPGSGDSHLAAASVIWRADSVFRATTWCPAMSLPPMGAS